jgi:hypothetical protein
MEKKKIEMTPVIIEGLHGTDDRPALLSGTLSDYGNQEFVPVERLMDGRMVHRLVNRGRIRVARLSDSERFGRDFEAITDAIRIRSRMVLKDELSVHEATLDGKVEGLSTLMKRFRRVKRYFKRHNPHPQQRFVPLPRNVLSQPISALEGFLAGIMRKTSGEALTVVNNWIRPQLEEAETYIALLRRHPDLWNVDANPGTDRSEHPSFSLYSQKVAERHSLSWYLDELAKILGNQKP